MGITMSNNRHPKRGSAIVVVLITVSILTTLLVANGVVLRNLQAELHRLESQQIQTLQTRYTVGEQSPASPSRMHGVAAEVSGAGQ